MAKRQSLLSQLSKGDRDVIRADARFGELGKIPNRGRVSTEFSITEFVPELGGWVNIPTLVRGQEDINGLLKSGRPTRKQSQIAINRAIERVKGGAKLPSFKSVEAAVSVAQGLSVVPASRRETEKLRPFSAKSILGAN